MSATARHTLPKDFLPAGEPLTHAFFARSSDEVAADLVGKILWRKGFGGGRLAEVEAYLPQGDPASHAAAGQTKRNTAMFGPPGRLYVFLSYGVHRLLNFVCDEEDIGSAVLVRSFEPLPGIPHHGMGEGGRGPGVVGRLLGVELKMSGLALGEESGLFVVDDGMRPEVGQTVRVGITRGAQMPLRYYMKGSRYVSGPPGMIGEN